MRNMPSFKKIIQSFFTNNFTYTAGSGVQPRSDALDFLDDFANEMYLKVKGLKKRENVIDSLFLPEFPLMSLGELGIMDSQMSRFQPFHLSKDKEFNEFLNKAILTYIYRLCEVAVNYTELDKKQTLFIAHILKAFDTVYELGYTYRKVYDMPPAFTRKIRRPTEVVKFPVEGLLRDFKQGKTITPEAVEVLQQILTLIYFRMKDYRDTIPNTLTNQIARGAIYSATGIGELNRHAWSEFIKALSKFSSGDHKSRYDKIPEGESRSLAGLHYAFKFDMGPSISILYNATLEYLSAEILDIASNEKDVITPQDILQAIQNDRELRVVYASLS